MGEYGEAAISQKMFPVEGVDQMLDHMDMGGEFLFLLFEGDIALDWLGMWNMSCLIGPSTVLGWAT